MRGGAGRQSTLQDRLSIGACALSQHAAVARHDAAWWQMPKSCTSHSPEGLLITQRHRDALMGVWKSGGWGAKLLLPVSVWALTGCTNYAVITFWLSETMPLAKTITHIWWAYAICQCKYVFSWIQVYIHLYIYIFHLYIYVCIHLYIYGDMHLYNRLLYIYIHRCI